MPPAAPNRTPARSSSVSLQLSPADRRLREHLRQLLQFHQHQQQQGNSATPNTRHELTYLHLKHVLVARHTQPVFQRNKKFVQNALRERCSSRPVSAPSRPKTNTTSHNTSNTFDGIMSRFFSTSKRPATAPNAQRTLDDPNTQQTKDGIEAGKPDRSKTKRLFGGIFSSDKKKAPEKEVDHAALRRSFGHASIAKDVQEAAEAARKSVEMADVQKPSDVGVAFAYGCLIATQLSPMNFADETDPEYKWRDKTLETLLARFELGQALTTMKAISHGEVEIEWTKMGGILHKSPEPPRVVLRTFVELMAQESGYDSRTRSLLLDTAERVGVGIRQFEEIECALATYAIVKAESEESEEVKSENAKKKKNERFKRNLKIGFGTLVGGVVIGVTGGLAAPLVAVGAGAALGTAAGAALATSGGIIAIGVLFGSGGAGLLAYKTNKRYGKLKEFEFKTLSLDESYKSLGVVINVAGWIPNDPQNSQSPLADFIVPFLSGDEYQETYTLVWESAKLYALAKALINFFSEQVAKNGAVMALKHTVLATFIAALALPATLITASDLIDNPWGVVLEAAEAAGLELAHVLLERVQGRRPVTLVGSSIGSLVIVTALKELAERKEAAGIVQDVYLFGAPCSGQSKTWDPIMPLIAGKLVCCLASSDAFVKLMMRGLSVETCVAGLEGINHPRALNIDVSSMISFHTDWVTNMPKLQHIVGLSTSYCDHPGYGHVGHRVHVRGKGDGVIRFCGHIDEKEPILHDEITKGGDDRRCEWLGIALDDPVGDRYGTLKHGRYFDCPDQHGIFIPYHTDAVRLKASRPGLEAQTVQCYSPSVRSGGALPHGVYSPVTRLHIYGLARLAPTPGNNQITEESSVNTSSAWGKGRLLRAQQEHPAVSPATLPSVKLRFAQLDEYTLYEAEYHLVFSAPGAGEWIIKKKFSQFKALQEALNSFGTEVDGFPDDYFFSAKKRQPILERWLVGVLARVPDMQEQALELVYQFLEVVPYFERCKGSASEHKNEQIRQPNAEVAEPQSNHAHGDTKDLLPDSTAEKSKVFSETGSLTPTDGGNPDSFA